MARDRNEEVPQFTGFMPDPETWPTNLPEGVTKDPSVWYAHRRTYADGRTEWEFRKRGSGGGPNGEGDAIFATVAGTPIKSVKEQWDKEAKAEADAPPTRVINGVPHERGPDGIYRPVQTEAGAAAPGAPSQAQAAAPGGRPYIDDGPEAGQTGRRWGWNPETRLYDRDLGPSPSAQKPPEVADRIGKPTGNTRTRTENGQDIKETEYILPDGTREWRTQTAPSTANKPGAPTLKPDGKGGSIAVQVMPDGTIKSTPLPNIPSEATRVTVEGVVYEKGPDGKFAPAKGIPLPGASAKNVEPFVPDPSQPDLGVGAWAATQRAKIGRPSEAGGITQSEYDQAAKAAHDQASVYIQNVTSSQAVRRQQEQDERGQRNDLSNQAASDYGRAQNIFSEILQYTKPGSRAIMDVIPGIMAEQAKYRAQREATARPPVALHPMFQAMPVAAGVAPAAPPAAPMAPEQAAAVAPPPEIPMTPERAAGIMANPVFRPQPMVPPAAPPPMPGQGQDLSTPVGLAPPAPGMVSAWAGPMVAPPQPAPVAAAGQPTLALGPRPPVPTFDPLPTAGKLAQWGVDADILAQAMAEMGVA